MNLENPYQPYPSPPQTQPDRSPAGPTQSASLPSSQPQTNERVLIMPGGSRHPTSKVFAGKVFVLQGTFGPPPRTHANVGKMIKWHGGEVELNVGKRTTHVVTTLKEFRRRPPNILKAIARGKGRTRIVAWEYIEDSIFTKNSKPREMSANYYEIQSVLQRLRKFNEAKAIYAKQYVASATSAAKMVDADQTGFNYQITLTRRIPRPDDNKTMYEKFTMLLFESNATPHTYMTGIRYNRPGKPTSFIFDYLIPSEFARAFKNWKAFFRLKSGIPWDKRLDGLVVESLEAATGKGLKGEETLADEKAPFIYTPPSRELPRGAMPANWVDPVEEKLRREKEREAERRRREMEVRERRLREEEEKLRVFKMEAERLEREMRENAPDSQSEGEPVGLEFEEFW